jgi:hypothetical protein
MEVPIVFDSADLKMGNRWILLYRDATPTAPISLVPLTGSEGQRFNYLSHDVLWAGNHNSDLLYFGTTLPDRRRMIGMPPPGLSAYFDNGLGLKHIKREITYDYRRMGLSGRVRYAMAVMENAASEVQLFKSTEDRLASRVILRRSYTYDGSSFK